MRAATPVLQLRIEPFEQPGLAVELGEHFDLRAQHLGNHGDRNVVDRAHGVATQAVNIAEMDGRDEDHRGVLKPRMLTNHLCELKAVEVRHADVDQDDRDFVAQQLFECFLAGSALIRFSPRSCRMTS